MDHSACKDCKTRCISELKKILDSQVMDELSLTMSNLRNEDKILLEMKDSIVSEVNECISLMKEKTDEFLLFLDEIFLNRQRHQTSFLYLCHLLGRKKTINLEENIKCICFSEETLIGKLKIDSTLKLVSNFDVLKQVISELTLDVNCQRCQKSAAFHKICVDDKESCCCSVPSAHSENKLREAFWNIFSKESSTECDYPLYKAYLSKAAEFHKKKADCSSVVLDGESVESFEVIPPEDIKQEDLCCNTFKTVQKPINSDRINDSEDFSIVDSFGNIKLDSENVDSSDYAKDHFEETDSKCSINKQPKVDEENASSQLTPADVVKKTFSCYLQSTNGLQKSAKQLQKSPRKVGLPESGCLKFRCPKEELRKSLLALKFHQNAGNSAIPSMVSKNHNASPTDRVNNQNIHSSLKTALSLYFVNEDTNKWLKK